MIFFIDFSSPGKSKLIPSTEKIVLLAWDVSGIVLTDYLQQETITDNCYAELIAK